MAKADLLCGAGSPWQGLAARQAIALKVCMLYGQKHLLQAVDGQFRWKLTQLRCCGIAGNGIGGSRLHFGGWLQKPGEILIKHGI